MPGGGLGKGERGRREKGGKGEIRNAKWVFYAAELDFVYPDNSDGSPRGLVFCQVQ
jgi:hypothetical protein